MKSKRFDGEKFFGIVFADIMISFAAFIFILYILSSLQPHSKSQKDSDVDAQGRLCAELFWDNNRDVDLDLWGKSPIDENATGFRRMHTKGLSLFKDTLGFTNNPEHVNMEIMCSNQLTPGEWDFTVNYFGAMERPASPIKATVYIKLQDNSTNTTRTLKIVKEINPGQEITFFRFVIDDKGRIKDDTINSEPIYIRG
jgi:uncharacterized protein YfaP (DUF2135 family)